MTMGLDFDECDFFASICGNDDCLNVEGSYKCTRKCQKGFKRNIDDKCLGTNFNQIC